MKAVILKEFGGIDQMCLGEVSDPEVSKDEVLIKVEATALNRADLLQRKGLYPPPKGASDILGLEVAGRVIEAHEGAMAWMDRSVMALLSGGGYAEYVAVHKSLLIEVPPNLTTHQAAGFMEAFLTGWQALVWLGKLAAGETVLIHAGGSGVGTACIQLSKKLGARIITTASASKHHICLELGADHCIDYVKQSFDVIVQELTSMGVDLVVDFIGNPYFQQNMNSLASDGRMVLLGLLGGMKPANLNLAPVLFKRLTITGSTLRSRSLEYRGRLVQDFKTNCYQDLAEGRIWPVIDKIMPWDQVQEAHLYLEENKNQGKVILTVQ